MKVRVNAAVLSVKNIEQTMYCPEILHTAHTGLISRQGEDEVHTLSRILSTLVSHLTSLERIRKRDLNLRDRFSRKDHDTDMTPRSDCA